MISMVNIFTNPTFVNIAQNTKMAMTIETGLKATGRPAFILMDKNISDDTKKYAATKELLYQLTCLAVYLALVLPVFRKAGFQAFKKIFQKDGKCYNGFEHFNGLDDFQAFQKLRNMSKEKRVEELNKLGDKVKFTDEIKNILTNTTKIGEKTYCMVKGADEINSIVGSVAGLAILAPQVSHVTIHPIMRFLGMEKKSESSEPPKNIDTKA